MNSLNILVEKFIGGVGWKIEKYVYRRNQRKQKAWIMYSMQIIRQRAAGVLLLLNSVTTFFHKPGLVGLMFFLHIISPNMW